MWPFKKKEPKKTQADLILEKLDKIERESNRPKPAGAPATVPPSQAKAEEKIKDTIREADSSWHTGIRFIVLVMVNVIWLIALSLPVVRMNPQALALIIYVPSLLAIVFMFALFAFIYITRKASLPYFKAWRKGLFLKGVFSGNDFILRPQEYGSGVVFTSDGELKAYAQRGVAMWRWGGVDICPIVDEAGITADPYMCAALDKIHKEGKYVDYASLRKAYKQGVFSNPLNIEIPPFFNVPFHRLKSYIMGAATSGLMYSHTDYWAERKARMKTSLLGRLGDNMWIIWVCIGIAIIIFAVGYLK